MADLPAAGWHLRGVVLPGADSRSGKPALGAGDPVDLYVDGGGRITGETLAGAETLADGG